MAAILSDPSPRYTPQDVELARLDSASPSILSAPPPYEEAAAAAASFRPAVHLQIDTQGKPWLSFPAPLRPDPIPVFALDPDDPSSAAASRAPRYVSLRPERCSGSCYLVPADGGAASGTSAIPVLSTTTYRFGPNRPPRVRLFAPTSPPLSPAAVEALLFPSRESKHDLSPTDGGDDDDGDALHPQQQQQHQPWDDFTITSLGLLTRAVTFRTRLGTFQWRYASRRERRRLAASSSHGFFLFRHGQDGDDGLDNDNNRDADAADGIEKISSLLVLERVVRVALARNHHPRNNNRSRYLGTGTGTGTGTAASKTDEEVRTPVAYFARGAGLRTPGSGASSAGNGGRLVVDLSLWEEDRRAVVDDSVSLSSASGPTSASASASASKLDREMALVMIVTTCLLMLKREVDRRRAQQMAIIIGAASGGP